MSAHKMVGQRCAASPAYGKGRCTNLATWVYFGTEKGNEDVCFTFFCDDCVRPEEKHEACPASCFA
jgi:hypothetical protein